MSKDEQKRRAGEHALTFVDDGMTVGLGTGSTADHFVRALGEKIQSGWKVRGVATSVQTATLASSLNIPLFDLDDVENIDITVDGADEIDDKLRLIKGGGGALLREKIIARASGKIVTIADEAKMVLSLGAFPLPVEIVDFAWHSTMRDIVSIAREMDCGGHRVIQRVNQDGTPFVTDGGHFIIDCHCLTIANPDAMALALNAVPGIVDHGLFIGLSSVAVLGTETGIRVVEGV